MAREDTCLLTKGLAVFCLFVLCSASFVHSAGRILVLVDNINTQDTHSIFLNSLKGWSFKHLIVFCFVTFVTIVAYCSASMACIANYRLEPKKAIRKFNRAVCIVSLAMNSVLCNT